MPRAVLKLGQWSCSGASGDGTAVVLALSLEQAAAARQGLGQACPVYG